MQFELGSHRARDGPNRPRTRSRGTVSATRPSARPCLLTAVVDDAITEPENSDVAPGRQRLFSRPLDREELGRLFSIARQSGIQAGNYVLTVSNDGRCSNGLLALQGMFSAATAVEEDISPKKLATLRQMRDWLDLTDLEFKRPSTTR